MGTRHGEPMSLLRSLVGYAGDDCRPWPYSHYISGYGSVWFDGRLIGAHRAMCILQHGAPADPSLQAAHRCRQRDCVNPRHLRWATRSQNEADKITHGMLRTGSCNNNARLNEDIVRDIKRRIAAGERNARIAHRHNISPRSVSSIRCGVLWRQVEA